MRLNKRFADRRAGIRLAAMMLAIGQTGTTEAAEVQVISGVVFKGALSQFAPQFEKATGHRLVLKFGPGGKLRAWIDSDKPDVFIAVDSVLGDLVQQGKIDPGSVVKLARASVGLAVRSGAPKPDISSLEAVRRTLLSAKSITYGDPTSGSASALQFIRVMDRLGLTEALKDRTKLVLPPMIPLKMAELIGKGDAEIAISQLSELALHADEGMEIVGPLPLELQDRATSTVSAAIVRGAVEADAGKALIRFMAQPSAAPIYKAAGLEPG